jgi:hypothetical protein
MNIILPLLKIKITPINGTGNKMQIYIYIYFFFLFPYSEGEDILKTKLVFNLNLSHSHIQRHHGMHSPQFSGIQFFDKIFVVIS